MELISENFLGKLYNNSPEEIKKIIRFFHRQLEHRRYRWIKNVYTKFGQEQRKYIFISIARFCQINRPINGYYFEFGCCNAKTMRMAWDCFRYLFDWTYVGFDSFEGLPEISEIDKQEIFKKGKLKIGEKDFIKIVTRHGMPRKKLITIKGFYNKSLTSETKNRLLPKKAAVVYIDCDLYDSTASVLNFVKDFLQQGTIMVFDDWNCFYGDPNRGEKRAFREFKEQNPDLIFEDFIQTNEAKAFIYLGEKGSQ